MVAATMRQIPMECYPLFAMIGTGVTFGFYVAGKHLLSDPELRLRRPTAGPLSMHWQDRLATLNDQQTSRPYPQLSGSLTAASPSSASQTSAARTFPSLQDKRNIERMSATSASLSAI
ncbi:hypothetical protein DFS34DRAFT_588821 [Phlyctochytrium arcticum]|nr:hypothetical protein DFS34DRAFT_588821 [Phlyctochytrium arcticum]